MNTINVLHVASLCSLGGLETMLLDLLAKQPDGFRFFVFSPAPVAPQWQKKLQRYRIPFHQGSSPKQWPGEVAEYARNNQIQLAHLHNQKAIVGRTLKDAGVPVVIAQNHGSIWTISPKKQALEKQYIDAIDGVIAVSKACRTMFHHQTGYELKKITTIYNGINFDRLKTTTPVPNPQGKKVILTVCRLIAQKGIPAFLEAVPYVLAQRNDVVFWIVGSGPLKNELKSLAARLKVRRHVKFWDKQFAISRFYLSADVFVLVSIREALGNVLLEAGYFGKPCIASNVDGIPEAVIHNETGILLQPSRPVKLPYPCNRGHILPKRVIDGNTHKLRKPLSVDPKLLAQTILNLLNNPKRGQRMGRNAQKRVARIFNIERYRHDILQYYVAQLQKKGLFPAPPASE